MMSRINLKMKIDGVSSPWRLRKTDKKAYRNPKKDLSWPGGKHGDFDDNEESEQPRAQENMKGREQTKSGRNTPGKHIDIVV